MKKKINYIIPVFNEEENIEKLVTRLNVLHKELEYLFDITFINDGSRDSTAHKVEEISNKHSNINLINLSRNFGQQVAITAGLDCSSEYDAVIIMDADFQDPPELTIDMIEKWEEGFDMVYAKRRARSDNFLKKYSAKFYYLLLRYLANVDIPQNVGDFRLMDKRVVAELSKFRESNRFMRGLYSYVGFKQTYIEFDRGPRYAGKTKYGIRKMFNLAYDGILGFSTFPLTLISYFGFGVSALSLLGILYAILMRIFFPEITVSGWTFMVISILFMGGVQMITLGIIGNYIGKIYSEVQARPLYIIDSVQNGSRKNTKK